MASDSSRRFYLLTYPRTASNLLLRILALEDQPNLLSSEKGGYFFIKTIRLRMDLFKAAGRHLDEWTREERTGLMECYQICFEALQKHAEMAEAQGKDIFVKEHAPWLMEPVAETKWVFGENSTHESPWTVKALPEQTHSTLNETVLPDEFLKTWLPTFLIRHPALVFPSIYRTCVDLEGPEVAKTEFRQHALEMTMHWSRTLYDWYTRQLNASESSSDSDVTWPIILDADDVMVEPEVVLRYSTIVGMDPTKLKFSWAPASKEELDKMRGFERRMRSTISASAGIVEGKTSTNLDIDEEAKKWRVEFGVEEGEKIEKWVRAAMSDYEYMKARRLRPRRS
ncbi:hypothetical protein MMC08_008119 [Hypocenomyce scalaris]|nr:hypothetical protein [Hypocenomyce scalaris]